MHVQFKNRAFTSMTPTMTAIEWRPGYHPAVVTVHVVDEQLVEGHPTDPKYKVAYALKVNGRLVSKVQVGDWIVERVQGGGLSVVTPFALNLYYDPWYSVEEELAKAVGKEMGVESAWPLPCDNSKVAITDGSLVWAAAVKLLRETRKCLPREE